MSNSDAMNKRQFHRVAHDARATLSAHGAARSATIADLSLKGCLLHLAEDWQIAPDQVYRLSIHLTPLIKIEMDVVLAHQEGQHAGFRCQSIDLDSATALRRLLELNLADSDLLDRDIHALLRA